MMILEGEVLPPPWPPPKGGGDTGQCFKTPNTGYSVSPLHLERGQGERKKRRNNHLILDLLLN